MNNSNTSLNKYYERFEDTDLRYYGIITEGKSENCKVKIDKKRYNKIISLSENIKTVMERYNGKYFIPAKKEYHDYNINLVKSVVKDIKNEWVNNKKMINDILSKIIGKEHLSYNDDLAQSGILDSDEAQINSRMKTLFSYQKAEEKRIKLHFSLYAQYFHQFASSIEALTLRILMKNGYKKETFNRMMFFKFHCGQKDDIEKINGFSEYSRMYEIWNFIKHNNLSTYKKIKKNNCDILIEKDFIQGELACFYVNFSDALIEEIINGVELFLKGYCEIIFDENEEEADWNYEKYFLSIVIDEINAIYNPLGLPVWI